MNTEQPVPEAHDGRPLGLPPEIEQRFSEVKGAIEMLQQNVVGQQQFSSAFGALGERLDLLKKEVDALQIEVMKPARAWYRDAGVLVAIMAVLFSFGTAIASYLQISSQDRRAARSELRQLIQRMSALPKENIELTKTYEKDVTTTNVLSGFINQEYGVIARQAAEIIDRIPGDVSANEYHAVALALFNSNSVEMVPALVERGLAKARDYPAELELLRLYGNVLILAGDLEKGRARYQEALSLSKKYNIPYTAYIMSSDAITEMNWASSEFGQGQCRQTEKLLGQAKDKLYRIPANPLTDRLKQQEASYEEILQKNRGNCRD